jgi:hypothetical protein
MKPRESEELIEKKKNLMVLSSHLYAPISTMVFVPTNMKVKLSPKIPLAVQFESTDIC